MLIATWADAYGLETCTLSAVHAARRTLAAPCAQPIRGVRSPAPSAAAVTHTFVCACRLWPALVSALFFNLHIHVFAPLFSNYMGLGDKETFAMALRAHRLPFHVVAAPPHGIGITMPAPRWQPWRRTRYNVNAIAQVDDAGEAAFLHSNMEKPVAAVETDFRERPRRWRVVMPGRAAAVEPFADFLDDPHGCDACQLLCALCALLKGAT